ncbi:MAG: carboxypeptidase-like regulatory domain-containing protein, partial [Acidobacteriota bacterium]|nr:carboxypeptidase-like regulatory domain-containing protein [Acidobacteriota bacterium]
MRFRAATLIAWVFSAATCFGPACFGQSFYGSIVGSITDASGGAVPQATVTLTNLGTAERRSAQADDS